MCVINIYVRPLAGKSHLYGFLYYFSYRWCQRINNHVTHLGNQSKWFYVEPCSTCLYTSRNKVRISPNSSFSTNDMDCHYNEIKCTCLQLLTCFMSVFHQTSSSSEQNLSKVSASDPSMEVTSSLNFCCPFTLLWPWSKCWLGEILIQGESFTVWTIVIELLLSHVFSPQPLGISKLLLRASSPNSYLHNPCTEDK